MRPEIKILFHNKGSFLKDLAELRCSGGPKQQAAEQVSKIIGDFTLSGSTLSKLTNKGESRIPHCVKYDLRGDCRLVTVQNAGAVWLFYVGDHDDADQWIEANRGITVAAGSKRQIQQTLVSAPGTTQLPRQGIVPTTDPRPLLERLNIADFEKLVPQLKLRRDLLSITEGTDDDAIQEIIECISDSIVQSLLIDIIAHVRKGEIDAALTRIDLHFGRGVDVVAVPAALDEALATGDNSELVTDLTSLSPAERERLLSDDFEPWLLWLHPDQKRVVEEDFDSPAVLKGVSGSGKTVILIHRARWLAQKYPDETIGVLTLSRSLARLLENLLNKLCLEGEQKRIKVQAFYDYFKAISSHLGTAGYLNEYLRDIQEGHPMAITVSRALKDHRNLANDFNPLSRETLDDTWDEFWQIDEDEFRQTKQAVIDAIKGRGEYDVKAYLRDEFTLIRSAFSRFERNKPGSGNSYYWPDFLREGRAISLLENVRRNILRMLRRYEEYMIAGAMMDEVALSQIILPERTKLTNLPPALQRRCLLIDEFQDFSTLELSLLKQIPSETKNGLFLAGDTVQKVMVKDFNLSKAGLDRNYVRTRKITKNYRNSRQILQAAHSLVKHYGAMAAKHDSTIEVLDPEFAVRETAPPLAVKAVSPIDAAWKIAADWVAAGEREAWSVCIVSANPSSYPPARILDERPASVSAERLTGDYILHRGSMVVGTLPEVKGFEFSLIVIVGCDRKALPDQAVPEEEQWREALRLYVAMTRGRDQVVMVYDGEPSPFLLQMKDYLVWQKSEFTFDGARTRDAQKAEEVKTALAKKKVAPISVPKIKPARPWPTGLSPSARLCLLKYFERSVYRRPRIFSEAEKARHLQQAFAQWFVPRNVNGVLVSQLVRGENIRRDLVREIQEGLAPHGCSLLLDKE